MEKDIILVIDDNEIDRKITVSVFEDRFRILEASDGFQGLELLKENHENICAVLTDMIMPVMNGLDFLKEMQKQTLAYQIPTFVITGETASDEVVEAYQYGVIDVIAKPITPYVVKKRVDSVVELFEARAELSEKVAEQYSEIVEHQKKIIEINNGMIDALFQALEARSGETGRHNKNIRYITKMLLMKTELGRSLSQNEIELIAIASMMHDIGKISVPDAILNKPGKLTPEEYEIMKMHTIQGAKIMDEIKQLHNQGVYSYAYDIAVHHHERYDAKGYPDQLKGDEITLWAQIVGIADCYDALLSERCYKKPYSREKSIRMILNGECGAFSEKLLNCFLQCEPVIYEALYQSYKPSAADEDQEINHVSETEE